METDITILEVEWAEALGHFKSVGSPYLFGWLRALYVPQLSIADGRVSVVARHQFSSAWTEYTGEVTHPDAEALVRAVVELGLPDRIPRVESVPDSSDTWFASQVRVALGEKSQMFVINTECSGLRGQDADALRTMMQKMLALAGYDRDGTMFSERVVTRRD